MSTGKEVGKLYAYFLEAAARFVYHHVHKRMEIREPGKGMYDDLVEKLGGGSEARYMDVIMEHEHFTDRQKGCLTQGPGIDKKQLDFTIYVQIYSLLGGSITSKSMEYMRRRRNQLCHRSLALLQPNMTDEVFKSEWSVMRTHFESFNFGEQFLKWCDKEIF